MCTSVGRVADRGLFVEAGIVIDARDDLTLPPGSTTKAKHANGSDPPPINNPYVVCVLTW